MLVPTLLQWIKECLKEEKFYQLILCYLLFSGTETYDVPHFPPSSLSRCITLHVNDTIAFCSCNGGGKQSVIELMTLMNCRCGAMQVLG